MTTNQLKIWSNVKYYETALRILQDGVADHQLLRPSGSAAEDAALLSNAEVAFGQPDPQVVKESANLKWIHLDSAGYERYETPEMKAALQARGAVLTNSSLVYNEPCAQHLLAMMMSLARRLPQSVSVQNRDHSWPMMELRADAYLLNGQTALLLGFGAIAKRLTELLAPFRMNLIAVRRQKTSNEQVQVITEAELNQHLPSADHVINILPANQSTRGFVDSEKLNRLKPGAIFYNIGRGSTVDQTALLAALSSGKLAAAYLDVTEPEPLPPDHPLWTAPNCHITPHTAGGHIGEKERLVQHFLDNLNRFVADEGLKDRII